MGKYNEAIADYNKAISLDPDYADAYNNRGFAYKNKGDMDAERLLKKYFP